MIFHEGGFDRLTLIRGSQGFPDSVQSNFEIERIQSSVLLTEAELNVYHFDSLDRRVWLIVNPITHIHFNLPVR